jgi:hypothetical protein
MLFLHAAAHSCRVKAQPTASAQHIRSAVAEFNGVNRERCSCLWWPWLHAGCLSPAPCQAPPSPSPLTATYGP